jgi:ABC-type nitrate/sulfonate/bicarbonate transport system permease component
MGVVSCFFPVAISAAAGMREIDAVLIRVGRSFRAPTWKMVTSIYLPAMRQPVVNGFRLGWASRSSARCSPRPSFRTRDWATS